MAAPTMSVFHAAVHRVLGSWTVLQLAVQHGFGGRDSQVKADWMSEAISQWFSENESIEPDELEDFVADILDAEFNTVADDGSLPEISRNICGYWRLCASGKEAAVQEEIQRLPKPDLSGSRAQPCEDSDDEDEDQHPPNTSSSQASTSSNTASQDREETPMEEEDDGWTVVHKSKKK